MKIRTGPILGATATSSATVWLEWADTSVPPKLVLEDRQPREPELLSRTQAPGSTGSLISSPTPTTPTASNRTIRTGQRQ